ncbi:MAG TPA: serine hydrolase domain-containing protein [Vicinamibacterales bacterium]|nr:serine hydrolase domain-containing protein [Vicinamibacterales bacterium]
MRSIVRVGVVALTLIASSVASAQPLPKATPEAVGMSTERLGRMHKGMQSLVDTHQVSGLVTLVARDGKMVDLQAFGAQDIDAKTPMKTDSIFRIASMSKPITSVAIMMLFEEGKLALTDPVSRFIPAFREMRVLSRGAAGTEPALVPARRQITIRDLLTHRSGLTYGFIDGAQVGAAYRDGGVNDGLTVVEFPLADNIERLAKAPLVSQPGAEWHYSLSTDVLGRVVEVASGMPLDRYFAERIFAPLKMTDTSFVVPEAKWGRFVSVYTGDGQGGIRPMKDPESFGNTYMSPVTSYRPEVKKYFSGGAGLTSTAQDYSRFAQMLLNGGELDGVRLLGPKTVQLMTVSHTLDLNLPNAPTPVLGPGAEWGLGFKITTDLGASQLPGSVGMYGWSGIYGTFFWIDPKEKMVGVLMVQRYPGPPASAPFQALTYDAVITMK